MSKRPLSVASRTRNLFRVFFNSSRKRSFFREIQSLRRDCKPQEYEEICRIVEENPAYPFPGFGNTFPKWEMDIPNSRYRLLQPLSFGKEIGLQVARLNHHKAGLTSALKSISNINELIIRREFLRAEEALRNHRADHGLSFIYIKKELLVALEKGGLSGLARRYTALTSKHESTAWALLCHYVYDMMDPTFSPDQAMRNWSQLLYNRKSGSDFYTRLVIDDIQVLSRDEQSMAADLLRYSCLSIVDTSLWIWRKKALHPNNDAVTKAVDGLDHSTIKILEEHFTHLNIVVPQAYQLSGKEPSDLEVFRTSFFYNEIADVATWRSHFTKLIFEDSFALSSLENEDASIELASAVQSIIIKPESCRAVVNRLRGWELSFLSPSESICDQELLTTILVAESLRKLTPETFPNADDIANLMASTQNIQLYISIARLEFLVQQAQSQKSPLLRFVAQEMIYRKVRNQDNELERRLSFMAMIKAGPYENVLNYIKSCCATNREAALLLASICTRTFLERLFLVMTSLKDVLECRLQIAEWLEKHSSEVNSTLEEERDALQRELSNLEARSDLDSTRVYVDEESFRDWFRETQKTKVVRYSQTVLAEGPDKDFESLLTYYAHHERTTLTPTADQDGSVEDLSADTRIGSEHLLVSIIDAALHAFAFDRSFGLDAYLSRRIRHGTLSGHVMTPITRILNRHADQSSLFRDIQQVEDVNAITSAATEWRKLLVARLDILRTDMIQLRSPQHPSGLEPIPVGHVARR